MNRECAEFAEVYSNNGIYEAYFAETRKPRQSLICGLRARLAGLFRIVAAFLCSVRVRRVLRVGCATVALLGAVGVAGALETGRLAPVSALLLAAGFLAIVYLAIKPARRKKSAEEKSEDERSAVSVGTNQIRKRLADTGCRLDRL